MKSFDLPTGTHTAPNGMSGENICHFGYGAMQVPRPDVEMVNGGPTIINGGGIRLPIGTRSNPIFLPTFLPPQNEETKNEETKNEETKPAETKNEETKPEETKTEETDDGWKFINFPIGHRPPFGGRHPPVGFRPPLPGPTGIRGPLEDGFRNPIGWRPIGLPRDPSDFDLSSDRDRNPIFNPVLFPRGTLRL